MPFNKLVSDPKPNNKATLDTRPNNRLVSNIEPNNRFVSDIKTNNKNIIDVRPNNKGTDVFKGMERFYTVTINAGQSMGLLLALTYPTTFTVQAVRS